VTTRPRLDFGAPYATVHGEPGVRYSQGGHYYRHDGTHVEDPPDAPKPVLAALPSDNPDTPVQVDAETWEKYRKLIYGPPEGDGEVA
jgi:hypothetical protein